MILRGQLDIQRPVLEVEGKFSRGWIIVNDTLRWSE